MLQSRVLKNCNLFLLHRWKVMFLRFITWAPMIIRSARLAWKLTTTNITWLDLPEQDRTAHYKLMTTICNLIIRWVSNFYTMHAVQKAILLRVISYRRSIVSSSFHISYCARDKRFLFMKLLSYKFSFIRYALYCACTCLQYMYKIFKC